MSDNTTFAADIRKWIVTNNNRTYNSVVRTGIPFGISLNLALEQRTTVPSHLQSAGQVSVIPRQPRSSPDIKNKN